MNIVGKRCSMASSPMRTVCGMKKGLDRTSATCAAPAFALRKAASKSYGGFSSRHAWTWNFNEVALRPAALEWSADKAAKKNANHGLSSKTRARNHTFLGAHYNSC